MTWCVVAGLLPLFGAMFLFPAWAALAAGRLLERLEVARWWSAATLAALDVAVACVIYRDAARLGYGRILAALWRECWGG